MTEAEIYKALTSGHHEDRMPPGLAQIAARALFNLERLATAQEVIAGIRKAPVVPPAQGLNSGVPND